MLCVCQYFSDTTVHEVIRCLLSKFRITDSPRKFVLYVNTMSADGKCKFVDFLLLILFTYIFIIIYC